MVKIFQKEEKRCNGKLILTNFNRLRPQDFYPLYEFDSKEKMTKQAFLYSPDGRMYINTEHVGYDTFLILFEGLLNESRVSMEEYEEEIAKKYPDIKTFSDWEKIALEKGFGDKKVAESLLMLMVPLELRRRNIERDYYGY